MDDKKSVPHRVMIDIETLSTKPNAHILSIGAVWIDSELQIQQNLECDFYRVLDKEQGGRHIDPDTVEWWMWKENRDAYPRKDKPELMTLGVALTQFNWWIIKCCDNFKVPRKEIEFWAKGIDFDFVILKDAYSQHMMSPPWAYNMVRDLRTVLKRTSVEYSPKEMNPEIHNALGDAKFQAMQLITVLRGEVEYGNQTRNLPT